MEQIVYLRNEAQELLMLTNYCPRDFAVRQSPEEMNKGM